MIDYDFHPAETEDARHVTAGAITGERLHKAYGEYNMLNAIENKTQDIKGRLIVHEENGYRYMATLHVMYHQDPEDGEPFIELRQWGTVDGYQGEIVAEWGYVTEEDELETNAAILPYWYSLEQALTFVSEQLALEKIF